MFHIRVTQEALEEHESLLAAFRARDPQAAYDAMRIHIERSRPLAFGFRMNAALPSSAVAPPPNPLLPHSGRRPWQSYGPHTVLSDVTP